MGILGDIQKTNIDSYSNNIIITTITDNTMMREADLINPAGEDSIPLKIDTALLVRIEGINQKVAVGVVSQSQGAKEGEKILYSRDAQAELVAKIHLKNTGELYIETKDNIDIKSEKELNIEIKETANIKSNDKIILNSGDDYAVKFNELNKEMEKLKKEINQFIKIFNSHIHPHPQGNTASPSPPTASNISLDISQAKSETVQIP